MTFVEKIISIYNYTFIFVKKQYRISFSKKLAYISDEFSYFSENICVFLSKILSAFEIIFNMILPLTAVFYPINLKYIVVVILFITYLTKIRELKVRSLRTYFHKLFIKDAVFQFYGLCIIGINLIIMLDVKSIMVFLLILLLSCIRVDYINNLYLYGYAAIYLFITGIVLKSYVKFFILIAVFTSIISIFYLFRKKSMMNKNYNVKLNKAYIVIINMKKLIRKLYRTPQEAISFIFPFYIVIYSFVCYGLYKINFLLDEKIIAVEQVCIYFVIYYGYTKMRILAFDDCFYFCITKIEFLKLNIILNYIQKVIVGFVFNIFGVFWGVVYLIKFSNLSYNFQTIFSLVIMHVLIIFLCLSANVYVDKNKLDVTKQPEDLRRYMSFLEALFLSSVLVTISLFFNLTFREGVPSNLVNDLVSVDTAIFILKLIICIGASLSVIKTLNYMLIVKLNIRRRL